MASRLRLYELMRHSDACAISIIDTTALHGIIAILQCKVWGAAQGIFHAWVVIELLINVVNASLPDHGGRAEGDDLQIPTNWNYSLLATHDAIQANGIGRWHRRKEVERNLCSSRKCAPHDNVCGEDTLLFVGGAVAPTRVVSRDVGTCCRMQPCC